MENPGLLRIANWVVCGEFLGHTQPFARCENGTRLPGRVHFQPLSGGGQMSGRGEVAEVPDHQEGRLEIGREQTEGTDRGHRIGG